MANGKRLRREDNKVDLTISSSQPAREVLPRRCKAIQPNYGLDNDFELDVDSVDDQVRANQSKKTGSRSSPMSKEKAIINTMDKGQPSRIHGPEKEDEKEEELMTLSILSWLIEMNVVQRDQSIWCVNMSNGWIVGKGAIQTDGVLCVCCGLVYTVFEFQRHVQGFWSIQPYENMFIEGTGVSLLTCQIEAWNRHSVPARDGYHHVVRKPRVPDHHDDTCVICADGGDLLCCEQCPSTYHPKCLGFQGVPQVEWICPYCCCKYCNGSGSQLLTCSQCLKKYHWQCFQTHDMTPEFFMRRVSFPFCGRRCWNLYQNLDSLVGRTMHLSNGFSWTVVKRMDVGNPAVYSEDLYRKTNSNSIVVLAAKLMEDGFKKIFDRQTGTNMIQNVVYSCGSNFTRTNFSRFYTVVLQFQGCVVSAASIRTPSPEVAEMPFITTAEKWRNRGMCRSLLLCIESFLTEFGVERIVIPSSENMAMHWVEKFGFIPVSEAVKREIARLNTLTFPRTTRLQKLIRIPSRRVINDLNSPPINDLNLPPPEN